MRRVFILSLVASVALHALALQALPAWVADRSLAAPPVLDVVLVQAQLDPDVARPVLTEPRAAAPLPRQAPREGPVRPTVARPSAEKPVLSQPLPTTPAPPVAAGDSVAGTTPAVTPRAELPGFPVERKSQSESAVTPPSANASYLRNPPPRYPLIARRNGEQGTVMLKVLVTRDGLPSLVSVEKTSGSTHLDQAALDTVKTWKFAPARRGEQSVEAWVLVPVVFRLEGVS